MANRFYCPDLPRDDRFTLDSDEARHLARVIRAAVGDEVEVFDGRGFGTRAVVVAIGRDRVELAPVGAPLTDRRAPCRITLASAVPKGERFDWLVEKATELGVARLVPIVTERSVVEPREAKLTRLRRMIVEAAKQCGRNVLMELGEPVPWPDLITGGDDCLRLMAHPGAPDPPAWPSAPDGGAVTLAVGPEGGFTTQEVESALRAGWRLVGLGATLLRIETAGLAGCAAILAHCERVNR